jgi:hypothetical protein
VLANAQQIKLLSRLLGLVVDLGSDFEERVAAAGIPPYWAAET